MDTQDSLGEEEPVHEEEKEPWRPSVYCPHCHGRDTRLLTLQYEMSLYLCEQCRVEFEMEEPI